MAYRDKLLYILH